MAGRIAAKSAFAVFVEYPEHVAIGSVVVFEGKRIEVAQITQVGNIGNRTVLVSGRGNVI